MKNVLVIFICVLSCIICQAKYARIPLPQLIDMSELIVEGKIIHVSLFTVRIEILEVVKGELTTKKKLTVSKFSNWECASRWSEYKKGQTELLFLVRNDLRIVWKPIGIGNEGEMPIENDFLYYSKMYGIDSTSQKFQLDEGFVYGYKFPLADVKNSIKEYNVNKDSIKQSIGKENYTTDHQFLSRIINELIEIKSYSIY
jgi:hypothetical protein